MKKQFKFSVIIPIYNVEEYLAETIESVINQTVGFEKNIQIILVNDGSPDNSEKICLDYVEKYPDNITYVKQKNAGVSAARNKGLEYATGEYINFLDSDDIWEKNAFKKALNMFNNHNEIDVVAFRQKYFEASTAYPSLDFKFDRDKIIDIFEDYDHIQLSVTSAFVRQSSIENVRFDTRVKISEDAKFLFEIVFKKCKMGIISSSLYLYRKRYSANSAIQTKLYGEDWYLVTPELCYKFVYDLSMKKFGRIIEYAQYYIAYEYQWRVKEPIPSNISQKVIDKYLKISKELLSKVNDDIILSLRHLSSEYKIKTISFKNGSDIRKKFKFEDDTLSINDTPAINLSSGNIINLSVVNFYKDYIELKGLVRLYLDPKDYKIDLIVNDKEKISIELNDTPFNKSCFLNEPFITDRGFRIKIKKKDLKSFYFQMTYKKHEIKMLFHTGVSGKLDLFRKLYYVDGNKVYYGSKGKILCRRNTLLKRMCLRLRNIIYLMIHSKWRQLLYRELYFIYKLFNRNKKIWLISDRPYTANDNGYAFFKYLNTIECDDIDPYFVITKDSVDFEKVKATGKYLIYNSIKYKMYFLLAEKIISSQADLWVTNPFGRNHNYYHDLYRGQFVFLQHGITKDDMSNWLNDYSKDIKIFITSAKKEYESIITEPKYGYNEDVVKLTGFARYDLLENKAKKQIVIMPTWRTNLASSIDNKTGKRLRNAFFNSSDYFKFYNNLINDERIIKKMKDNGYTGIFVLHPAHIGNIDDFEDNDVIKVARESVNYSQIFSESALLISDYSSVIFDFAYLKKPVIYCEFDKKTFFKNQIYDKGYFDTEKNGFGPVTNDYESLVREIIHTIDNNCVMEPKYINRVDEFYEFTDRNNCERIYKEIRNMEPIDEEEK